MSDHLSGYTMYRHRGHIWEDRHCLSISYNLVQCNDADGQKYNDKANGERCAFGVFHGGLVCLGYDSLF